MYKRFDVSNVSFDAKLLVLFLISKKNSYLLPINNKTMDKSTRTRSTALAFRLCSWKKTAPNRKLTMTLLRRIMDTIEIIAPGKLSA